MRKYYESEDTFPPEEEFLYLLLVAPGYTKKTNEPVKGNTWLQKTMHVLSQSFEELNYDFDAYSFGTYSPDLKTIQIQSSTSNMIQQPNENGLLSLTEKGLRVARKLWQNIPDSKRHIISETKAFLNDMTLNELIAFSYSTFPDTASKSEIIPEFTRTRLDSAVQLFAKKKVSLKKAASIAGLSENELAKILNQRNIPAYSISKSDFEKSLKTIESIT